MGGVLADGVDTVDPALDCGESWGLVLYAEGGEGFQVLYSPKRDVFGAEGQVEVETGGEVRVREVLTGIGYDLFAEGFEILRLE